MLFYIKDRKTFKTKAVVEGASWRLIESVWTDLSEMVVSNNETVSSGDIVFNMDGWRGIIKDIERDGSTMSLRCEKMETMFDRTLLWTGLGRTQACEWSLAYFLNHYYINESDTQYVIPYLLSNRVTLDAGASQPITDRGTFKVSSYIAQVRRLQNVFTYYDIVGDTLTARIQYENRPTKKIFTTGMPVEIVEESFSKEEITAKVTTYSYTEDYPPVFDDETDWYLFTDGTISTDVNYGTRAEGKWVSQEVFEEDTPETIANNIFRSNNSASHKVIVRIPDKQARYNFYDPVDIELNGHMYQSYISRKTITSDGFVEYTLGDLKTTLTDKINELN